MLEGFLTLEKLEAIVSNMEFSYPFGFFDRDRGRPIYLSIGSSIN